MTVTFGPVINLLAAVCTSFDSCSGVSPAARRSFRTGREIFPSGRTTTSTVQSFSRQKNTVRTSSGPMTYPAGSDTPDGARLLAAAGGAGCRSLRAWAPTTPGASINRAASFVTRRIVFIAGFVKEYDVCARGQPGRVIGESIPILWA